MRKLSRCPGCGRMHKKGHDAKVGTDRAYSPNCIKYKPRPNCKVWYPGKGGRS